MVLPVPGGGDEGGGDGADPGVDPSEAEHGRAIYCNAADSGPLQGGGETDGETFSKEMVGGDGYRLEGVQGKIGRKGRRRSGGGGRSGVDGLVLGANTPGGTTGGTGEEVYLGANGSSGAEWSGAED